MQETTTPNKISETEIKRILALPSLSSFFPIKYANGSSAILMPISCLRCNIELPAEGIRAKVSITEYSASVSAWAVCFDCRNLTQINMRFRDDGTMLFEDPAGIWHERRCDREQSGLIGMIMAMIRKITMRRE